MGWGKRRQFSFKPGETGAAKDGLMLNHVELEVVGEQLAGAIRAHSAPLVHLPVTAASPSTLPAKLLQTSEVKNTTPNQTTASLSPKDLITCYYK